VEQFTRPLSGFVRRKCVRGRRPIRGDAGAAVRTDREPWRTAPAASNREFEELYQQYWNPLYALCFARLHDRALAEDVTQDVFAKALVVLPRYDRDRPFWPWLASIAARECIDAHRRRSLASSRHAELASVSKAATPDTTSRTVLGRMAHDEVSEEIGTLPVRQRAALQLFALDGWTYAEIADRLGCSVGTVKLLIVRARCRLRQVRARVLAGIGPALQNLAARFQGLFGRAGALSPWAGPVGLRGAESLAGLAVVAAAAMVGLSMPAAGYAHDRAAAATPAPAAVEVPSPTTGVPTPPARATTPAPAAVEVPPEPAVQQQSREAQRAVNEAADDLLGPSEQDSGESQVQSITVSPGYEEDRTVFVVDGSSRLFVSRDGGASWSRRRALGMMTRRILLPPAYPRDSRIFALGYRGLQMSDNDGDTFETVAPGAYDDAAFSPGFDAGDPTVLLVGSSLGYGESLKRYDARTGLLEPLLLDEDLAGHFVAGIGYDPGDPTNRTIRLLSRVPVAMPSAGSAEYFHTSHIGRCTLPARPDPELVAGVGVGPTRLTCTSRQLERFVSAVAGLRTSNAGSDTQFVRGPYSLLVSTDAGQTFRPASTWNGPFLTHNDVVTVPGSPGSLLLARVDRAGQPALLRTRDAGATWTPLYIDVPGFTEERPGMGQGATAVAVTPTGRIIAGGYKFGVACSVDDGRTWSPLCPTPDAV
jgi:RNA polymerase sigma-70 factor (ECF subfamily)